MTRVLVLGLMVMLLGAVRAEAAVTAVVSSNQLRVTGDDADNAITLQVAPLALNEVEVRSGNAVVGSFARASFSTILITALGGSDTVLISRAFGVITQPATISGGAGHDAIRTGPTDDTVSGGPGDDTFTWVVGDGNDVVDGGDGPDDLVFQGTGDAENIFVQRYSVVPGAVAVSRDVNVAATQERVVVTTTSLLRVSMLGGDDLFAANDITSAQIGIFVDAGDGDDEVQGGNLLFGGNGNDYLQGGDEPDSVLGGPGDDVIVWVESDASDTIEGGDGRDLLAVFGPSTGNELFTIAPNGSRVRVFRNVENVALDVGDVEEIQIATGAGDDTVTAANGLAATGLTRLVVDTDEGNDVITGGDTNDVLFGGAGDDTLIGGPGDDELVGDGGVNLLKGGPGNDLFTFISVDDGVSSAHGEEGIDRVSVPGLDNGDDVMAASAFAGVQFKVDRATFGGTLIAVAGIEQLEISTKGNADTITIGPGLTGIGITVDGGAGADLIRTHASSVVTLTGDDDADQLVFDALNQPVSVTPSTIAAGGVTRATYVQIENVRFENLVGALPAIAITSPTADASTTAVAPFLRLAGTASDAEGIASVTFRNDRGGSGAAAGTTAWTAAHVPLEAGTNVLTATVRDTAGNEVSDTLTVQVSQFTYTMAEGATGAFFDTDILIVNPNSVEAPITITYLKGDGTTVVETRTLAPTSRTTINVDQIAGLENADVSATVTSTAALPLVVERTMRWDASGYGAHTEKATDGPSTTWFFAEGSQGFFDTYVLLANPGTSDNTATVTFLLESGTPIVKTFALAPTSRLTVPANTIPEVVGRSFGIVVSFTQPGVAERAMYFGVPVFNAGHESAGVTDASTSWFLAEGATGSFFTTFVLLANPGTTTATATVTFLPESGVAVTKTKTVPAGGRVTLNIAAEDSSLASGAIATAVESTTPILVERAQYWPSTPDRWYEAHNSFGSTAVGTKWGLAEGRVGGPEGYQTYILLANASASGAAQVRITFLRVNGTTVVKTFTVNPTSRLNVHVNGLPELANESFGALIEVTSGPGIFVERALYADAQGVVFAAGTNALATRLP